MQFLWLLSSLLMLHNVSCSMRNCVIHEGSVPQNLLESAVCLGKACVLRPVFEQWRQKNRGRSDRARRV